MVFWRTIFIFIYFETESYQYLNLSQITEITEFFTSLVCIYRVVQKPRQKVNWPCITILKKRVFWSNWIKKGDYKKWSSIFFNMKIQDCSLSFWLLFQSWHLVLRWYFILALLELRAIEKWSLETYKVSNMAY